MSVCVVFMCPYHTHTYTPCLMIVEVSLETSPKNIMIQDMIISENSMNPTESTNTNIFKINLVFQFCQTMEDS